MIIIDVTYKSLGFEEYIYKYKYVYYSNVGIHTTKNTIKTHTIMYKMHRKIRY